MIRRHTLLVLFFFLATAWCHSQSGRLDSLKAVLPATAGEIRLAVLLQLAEGYYDQYANGECLQFAAEAISLAEKRNDKFRYARALGLHGMALTRMGNDSTGFAEVFQAIDVSLSIGVQKDAAVYYIELANFSLEYDKPNALEYLYRALKLYEELQDTVGMAYTHLQIGHYNTIIKNFPEAEKNLVKSRHYLQHAGEPGLQTLVHQRLASYYRNTKQFDLSLEFDSLALSFHLQQADTFSAAWVYASIARTLSLRATDPESIETPIQRRIELEQALSVADKANNMFTLLGYPETEYAMMKMLAIRGGILYKLGRLNESRIALERSVELGTAANHSEILQDGYEHLAKLDSAEGKWEKAFHSFQQYIFYRDKNLSDESVRQGMADTKGYEKDKALLETKLENARKEAAGRRLRLAMLFGIIILLVAAGFLFINSRQKQRSKQKIEAAYLALQQTQTQLVHAEKMASLGELTAGIAHEIQNPLNFVNNFAELNAELIEEMRNELAIGNTQLATDVAQSIKENEEKIIFHGKRADAIVKSMLQHSRSSSGQKELTDINALVDEYVRLAYHGMRAKDKSFNADLQTSFDPSIGKLKIVGQDIGRVMLNLLTNAFFAVNEKLKSGMAGYKPVVSVSTMRKKDKIEITISDNGMGIPANVIEKIFQPFFTTKSASVGTGLGLSISYDIIKAHGGEIQVTSTEGEGTKFTILLPIA